MRSEFTISINELLRLHPLAQCDLKFGPVPTTAIEQVERKLDVTLPDSFRSYLETFAGGLMFDYEIAGIPTERAKIAHDSEASAIIDIVELNEAVRDSYPQGHVFICDDGGDFSFFLEAISLSPERECLVLIYGPGEEGRRIADDFLHFLTHLTHQVSFSSH